MTYTVTRTLHCPTWCQIDHTEITHSTDSHERSWIVSERVTVWLAFVPEDGTGIYVHEHEDLTAQEAIGAGAALAEAARMADSAEVRALTVNYLQPPPEVILSARGAALQLAPQVPMAGGGFLWHRQDAAYLKLDEFGLELHVGVEADLVGSVIDLAERAIRDDGMRWELDDDGSWLLPLFLPASAVDPSR